MKTIIVSVFILLVTAISTVNTASKEENNNIIDGLASSSSISEKDTDSSTIDGNTGASQDYEYEDYKFLSSSWWKNLFDDDDEDLDENEEDDYDEYEDHEEDDD